MKIKKSELKQLIKEEIEATMDEGMFDFITGGSFDAEAFKKVATEKLSQYGLTPPREGENAERVAEQTGEYLSLFMDDPDPFVGALEDGIDKATLLVFKQPKFMRAALRQVLASIRRNEIKDILSRGAYKDWEQGGSNQYGLSDFNSSSDADYDEWMNKHPDEAAAISKIVATIMAEYYHNAFYGSESEYGTGGKEEEAFMNALSDYHKEVFRLAKALVYYPALQGREGQLTNPDLAKANREGNLAQGIARHLVSNDDLRYLRRLMKDVGYDKTNPQLFKQLSDFDHYDIADKIKRNQ
mgnify:FL=1|tara:strand:+ start:150 stop:1043 length:894 start_codon:yes stop_codon:yes gene_type:complete